MSDQKATWERKSFIFLLLLPLHSWLSKEVRVGAQGSNLEAGNEGEVMEVSCLLTRFS